MTPFLTLVIGLQMTLLVNFISQGAAQPLALVSGVLHLEPSNFKA